LPGKSSSEIEIPQTSCENERIYWYDISPFAYYTSLILPQFRNFVFLGAVTIVLLHLLIFIEAAPSVPLKSASTVAKKYAMEVYHPGLK